jgi:SAM-dependent methyltransferase
LGAPQSSPTDRWGSAATDYAEFVAPTFVPLEEYLLDLAGAAAGERALDIGCGAGLTCRLLARRLGPRGLIVGVDPAEGMLTRARTTLPPVVRLARMEGGALGLRPGSFDLVTCAFAFHLVDRPAEMLRATLAALRPGGRLALCAWGERADDPAGQALDTLLYADARPAPVPGARRSLRRGDTGPAVRALQAALLAAGADLRPDGIFAAGTETALRDFQRRTGLVESGVAGAATRRRLEEYAPAGDPTYRMQGLRRPGRLRRELVAAGFAPVRIRRRLDTHRSDAEAAWRLASFWRRADLQARPALEREAIEELARAHLSALAAGPGIVWQREVIYAIARRPPASAPVRVRLVGTLP